MLTAGFTYGPMDAEGTTRVTMTYDHRMMDGHHVADILAGFDAEAAEDSDDAEVRYSGEDVDIRLYDDVAVVAFRLVGTPADGTEVSSYFNTGTFLKRDGEWRVIAWQATRIPAK